jgi:hypothetical protein
LIDGWPNYVRAWGTVPMPSFDVRIEYHSPDRAWAAVFIRDGEPWYLDGALVGMSGAPASAVAELVGQAQHLVLHGENFLTEGQIPLEDRKWLFSLLDLTTEDDEMYLAIRNAEMGIHD